ncbi:MAG: hypothetical protein HC892_06690 [Saprospiraceae bacterium]|nr:hypothetical protein [Saprospiraceae bacterium]
MSERLVQTAYKGAAVKLAMHALGQMPVSLEELEALQAWLNQQKNDVEMETTFISVATALGWTILYSLWQFLLIALVLRLSLLLTSNRSATLRYVLGLCAMLSAILWAAFTFYEQIVQVEWLADVQALETTAETVLTMRSSEVSTLPKKDWSSWGQELENYLPMLTMLWLVGIVAIGISTLWGYAQLNHLYRVHAQWIGEPWQLRLCQLRAKMGIQRYVELCVSSVLHEPITFRQLRPVICCQSVL